jgi:hypothetical protein
VAARRQDINDFEEKIAGLQKLLGFENSFDAFCEAIEISRV